MRLWSIHPSYLDTKGLVALWREALLAQKVLAGKTVGYKNHPQLKRFRQHGNPAGAIAEYLRGVYEESQRRGYSFDKSKINRNKTSATIPVTNAQLAYEFSHLCSKLSVRSPEYQQKICVPGKRMIRLHPLFIKVQGPIESWEFVPKII